MFLPKSVHALPTRARSSFHIPVPLNEEVIEIDHDPLAKAGQRVAIARSREVWAKDMEDGKAVGLFNRGDAETLVTARWAELGIKGPKLVRDSWRQKDLGSYDGEFTSKVAPHGVTLVRVRSKQ